MARRRRPAGDGQFHEADHGPAALPRQIGIVAVRNTTGFVRPGFAVLALSEPIIGPQDKLGEFQTRVTFEGGTPNDPIAAGRFGVLLDPLDADAIGRGVGAGVMPMKLVVDPDHLYDFAEMVLAAVGVKSPASVDQSISHVRLKRKSRNFCVTPESPDSGLYLEYLRLRSRPQSHLTNSLPVAPSRRCANTFTAGPTGR